MKKIAKLKQNENANQGITLIVLVITILILLILAGITIATLRGENGLLLKAKESKEKTDESTAKEIITTKIYDYQISEISKEKKATLEGLKEYLKKDDEIEWINLYRQNQNLELEPIEEGQTATQAKIKLTAYRYEFIMDKNLTIIETKEKEKENNKIKTDLELEALLKEAKMTITLEDILNTPAIMEKVSGLIPIWNQSDLEKNEVDGMITYTNTKGEMIKTNSEYGTSNVAWLAFDHNEETVALSKLNEAKDYFIEYEFQEEVYAMQIKYMFNNGSSSEGTRIMVFQGYNEEKAQWEEITKELKWVGNGPNVREEFKNLNVLKAYKRYRIYVKSATYTSNSEGGLCSGFNEIQLYGVLKSQIADHTEENFKQVLLSNSDIETITLSQMVTNTEFTKRLVNALSKETVTNNKILMENLPGLFPTLTANDVIRSEIEGIVSYTDYTGGIIRTNSEYDTTSYALWNVFTENTSTGTLSKMNEAEGWYMEYEFLQPVYALKAKYRFSNGSGSTGGRIVVIQGFNEEISQWENLTEEKEITGFSYNYEEQNENLEDLKAYKRFRFYVKSVTSGDENGKALSGLFSFQLYGKIE